MELSLIGAIKKLAKLWVSFSLFLILIILLQTVFGKYGDDSVAAWSWLAINILPAMLLLMLGYLRHKNLSTTTLSNTASLLFKIIWYISICFLLTVAATLFLQPFGDHNKSATNKLHASDPGLFTLQGILLLAWGLFISKTEKLIKREVVPQILNSSVYEKDVFISYNHADKDTALLLQKKLEKENLSVYIDHNDMNAGDDIRERIQHAIATSRVVLSIVSVRSLLSDWVGMETIHTFYFEKFSGNKKFIAAYLDESFFALNFTSNAAQRLNEQLEDIKALIDKQHQLGNDTRDLNDKKSRLFALKNNVDEIVQRLRSAVCIDIKGGNLQKNFPLLVKSIRAALDL